MSRATPRTRALATRLITHEGMRQRASERKSTGTMHVIEKLRPHLASLMGSAGVRTLLARALVLGGAEVRWLRSLHIQADSSFNGLAELQEKLPASEYFEGLVVLLAEVLGLMVAFIGEKLTLRLLEQVWPTLSFDESMFGNKGPNEKTT
jgi:hypothetical protein